MTMIGRSKTIKGNNTIQYIKIGGDVIPNYNKSFILKDIFRGEKHIESVTYSYRTISNPTKPTDYDFKNVPGKGVQLFKVTRPKDPNDIMKNIKDSEALNKKPGVPKQIQVKSVCYNGMQYIKISGGRKPDKYLKSQIDTDLNNILQQLQKADTPLGKN